MTTEGLKYIKLLPGYVLLGRDPDWTSSDEALWHVLATSDDRFAPGTTTMVNEHAATVAWRDVYKGTDRGEGRTDFELAYDRVGIFRVEHVCAIVCPH